MKFRLQNQTPKGETVERKSIALANVDLLYLNDGRPVTLEAALKELKEYWGIPEPKQERNDPASDRKVLLQVVAGVLDEVRTDKKQAAQEAEHEKLTTAGE